MATTFHDAALAVDSASGTGPLNVNVTVTAGDLVHITAHWEGAAGATESISDTQSLTWSVANALLSHSNNDLRTVTYYAKAASSGTLTVGFSLSAARTFRSITAISFTPTSGTNLQLDGTGAQAQGTSVSPSAGSATPSTATGCAITTFGMYGIRTLTAGTGWTAQISTGGSDPVLLEYRIISSATSITGDGTLDSSNEYVAQMAIFKEVALGPTINKQPASVSIMDGDAAYLQIAAIASAGSLTYQWQDNRSGSFASCSDGTGATTQFYVTARLSTSATGRQYRCVVTDSNGSTTSSAATITVVNGGTANIGRWDPLLRIDGWF